MADCSKLAMLITRLAMNIGSREGINNLDDVFVEMQKHLDHMSREYLVEAIVEATKGNERQISETTLKLNRLKAQARRESVPVQRDKLNKSIAALEAKLKSGDVLPKRRPMPLESAELDRLRYEKFKVQKEIRREIFRLTPKSFWANTKDRFNGVRAIMTAFDFSAPLRQGGFIAVANPMRAIKGIPAMFKAFASEETAFKINEEILNRMNAPLYARHKLFLSPISSSAKLSKMEEAWATSWAESIPGVSGSERAYITFLNKLRADSFDAMVESLAINGQGTPKELDAIARFINEATGRGNLGGLESSAEALNTAFFAPRYAVSRFQMLLGHPMWGGTGATRKLIAKEYAKYLIGMGLIYALGKLAGGDIELNPVSSDFGKIRFGKTRIDPLSGISQATVLIARTLSMRTKTGKGEIHHLAGKDVPYGADKWTDIMMRFGRSKLSPLFSTPIDVWTGEDVVGQPVTLGSEAWDLVTPLAWQDIFKVMKEQGIPTGTAMSLLSIFGMGLMTYSDREKKKKKGSGFPSKASFFPSVKKDFFERH